MAGFSPGVVEKSPEAVVEHRLWTVLLRGSYAMLSSSAADTPRGSRASPTSMKSPTWLRELACCQAACACANSAAAHSQRARVHVGSPRLTRPNASPCKLARASCVHTYRTMTVSGERSGDAAAGGGAARAAGP